MSKTKSTIGIKVRAEVLDASAACVHLHGKGRKQRSVPLWHTTIKSLRAWLRANPERLISPHSSAHTPVVLTGRAPWRT
jgi:site-specific recombinase XerC